MPYITAKYIVTSGQTTFDLTPYIQRGGVSYAPAERANTELVALDGTKFRWRITKNTVTITFRRMRMDTWFYIQSLFADRVSLSHPGQGTDFYVTAISAGVEYVSGGNTWMAPGASVSLEEV